MIGDVANHLWQSTVFAAAVALLAIACRRNQARVRYGLWFAASLKFLVPFTLLAGLGSQLAWTPASPPPAVALLSSAAVQIRQVSEPFAAMPASAAAAPESPAPARTWPLLALAGVWVCGTAALVIIRGRQWRRIRAARRAGTPWTPPGVALPPGVQARATPGLLEPGVVGLWRPVLLVPADLQQHLTPRQLEAVLAHEICHIRRRDNLTAAIHMVVETIFWFHPLVWWIGARLVDERERACDEEVVRTLGEPRAYAEGIVAICRCYVQSPLAQGVGGSRLRSRIEVIMSNQFGRPLTRTRKIAIAAAAVSAVALPIITGATRAQPPMSPRFEVASIEPNLSGESGSRMRFQHGVFTATNVTLAALIGWAYAPLIGERAAFRDERVIEGPAWVRQLRFDVEATELHPIARRGEIQMAEAALQALLEERFGLVVETRAVGRDVYALRLARSDGRLGLEMVPGRSGDGCREPVQDGPGAMVHAEIVAVPPLPTPPPPASRITEHSGPADGSRTVSGCGAMSVVIARALSSSLNTPVIDRTGLSGEWSFTLTYAVAPRPAAAGGVDARVNRARMIVAAMQEQLGLMLEQERGTEGVLVIRAVQPLIQN